MALGIFVSDVACVGFCSLGAIPFFKNPASQLWLALAGSAILIGLGLKYLLNPSWYLNNSIEIPSGRFAALFTKGFLVNFVNPFVFLVWIAVIGYGRGKYGFTPHLAAFLAAALLAIITTDSLKVIFAHHIKTLIRPEVLRNVYRVIGGVLIAFGIRMFWYVI